MTSPVILGIDTSGHHCAVGLLMADGQIATRFEPMAKGQAENLLPLTEALLNENGIAWRELTALAVGIGPGNFTGIRIAVSAVRGLALGLKLPAIGVSNFELKQIANGHVCLPAPRDHRYRQLFANGQAVGPAIHEPTPDGEAAPLPISSQSIAGPLVQIAAQRLPDHDGSAPAPLYVKAPDAAPARDKAPVLLP